MTLEAKLSSVAAIAGLSIVTEVTETGNHQDGAVLGPNATPAVLPAQSATIVLRTSTTEATIEGPTGHGITTEDKVAVFFDGGYRYGCDVDSVDGDDITVSGGAGDNFPEAAGSGPHDIECTIAPRTQYGVTFDAADLVMLATGATQSALLVFSDGTDEYAIRMAEDGGWSWADSSGETNPLTAASVGVVTAADVYAATTTAPTVTYGALLAA